MWGGRGKGVKHGDTQSMGRKGHKGHMGHMGDGGRAGKGGAREPLVEGPLWRHSYGPGASS